MLLVVVLCCVVVVDIFLILCGTGKLTGGTVQILHAVIHHIDRKGTYFEKMCQQLFIE